MKRIKWKKIFDTTGLYLLLLFFSVFILFNTFMPLVQGLQAKYNLNQELEEKQQANNQLNNSIDILEEGASKQEEMIREKYQLSNDDELLFVFPEDE